MVSMPGGKMPFPQIKFISFFISTLILLVSCGGGGTKISGVTDDQISSDPQLSQYVTAIEEHPENSYNYLNLSSYLEEQGNEKGAMGALEQGLTTMSGNNEMLYNLGRLQLKNEKEYNGYQNFRKVMGSVEAASYVDRIGPYFLGVYSLMPVVFSSSDEAYPTVDSSGTYVYYQSNQYGNWDIFRIALSGGTPERLTDFETNEENPAVAPDGSFLILVSDKDDARPVPYQQKLRDVYYFDIQERSFLNLTENFSNDYMPKMCKFGKDVTFVSERNDLREDVIFVEKFSNVFMMEPKGKFQIALTKGNYFDSNPSISCSRRYLYFDSNRRSEYQNIYRIEIETKNMKSILPDGSWNNFAPITNTGDTKMVYVSDRDGNYELYLYDYQEATEERLTSSDAEDLNPVFIPNQDKILFHSNRSGSYDIYLLDLASKNVSPTPYDILSKIENKLIMLGGSTVSSSN